jgi:hypothetical protein
VQHQPFLEKTMSILEGLVKAEISPDIDTTIDMSKHAGDTYNIEKVEINVNVGNMIIANKELAQALADALIKRQIAESQPPVTPERFGKRSSGRHWLRLTNSLSGDCVKTLLPKPGH